MSCRYATPIGRKQSTGIYAASHPHVANSRGHLWIVSLSPLRLHRDSQYSLRTDETLVKLESENGNDAMMQLPHELNQRFAKSFIGSRLRVYTDFQED